MAASKFYDWKERYGKVNKQCLDSARPLAERMGRESDHNTGPHTLTLTEWRVFLDSWGGTFGNVR